MQNENKKVQNDIKEVEVPLYRKSNLNDNKCGLTPKLEDDRIVGGQEAEPFEYPWNVALTLPWGLQFCGGSLINKWVKVMLIKRHISLFIRDFFDFYTFLSILYYSTF